MKLSEFIKVLPALPEKNCADLIKFFEQNEIYHNKLDNRVQKFTELNVNSVDPALSSILVKSLPPLINTYTDLHCPTGDRFFPQNYGFEEFRIKRYNKGECFKQHVDVGDLKSSKRFLAFLFYLNDDFDEGGTLFRVPGTKYIKPKTGDCLIFPPTWQYPHEGMKATGTKYIMSTYLHYV